jgi:hypothetical protein
MKKVLISEPQIEIMPGTTIRQENLNSDSSDGQKNYQTSFDSSIVQVVITGINKTFADLILTIVTLIFMWFIIKIAVTSETGIKTIDDFTKKTAKSLEGFAGSLPIIPIAGGLSANSL